MLTADAWVNLTPLILAVIILLWWFRIGPSQRTRTQVAMAVESRGFKLLSVKLKPQLRLGRNSRYTLAVRAENLFGNVQTIYFDVDVWADRFAKRPFVRELGPGLSPSRYVISDMD